MANDLRAALLICLSVERWADDVQRKAPFRSSDELREAARSARSLSGAEVLEALTDHPRIGEAPASDSRSAAFARSEQAAADADDSTLARALGEGNRRYEERFGRVFLIRAAGRSRAEIVAELNRRLELSDDRELAIAASELRDIALARLDALSSEGVL